MVLSVGNARFVEFVYNCGKNGAVLVLELVMSEEQRTDGGWHEPEDRQSKSNEWYVPDDAATEEQLEALKAEIQTQIRPDVTELPSTPPRTGGWQPSREEPTFEVEPATSLGNLFDESFNDQMPEFETTEPEAPDFEPEPPPEPVEPEFLEPPSFSGDFVTGFVPAPEVPLSASLEGGFGGLRDEPAEAEAESGLTLEEAAQMAEASDPQPLEVPAQGFGGVQGGDLQGDSGDTQPDTKGDTGPLTPVDAHATRAMSDTGTVEPAPQMAPNDTGEMPQPSVSEEAEQQPSEAPQPQASTPPYPQQSAPAQPQASQPMTSEQQTVSAQRFREVEQSVQALRQQFAQGRITRNQLESELRRLMVMDEQGRWWTLGVDSSRWYRYDGREWIPDTPPQTSAQPAVQPDQVRTETGVQAPVQASSDMSIAPGGDISMQPGGTPRIAIDEYGMPLPQKVPQDDPGATMVNLQTALDSDEAPTLSGTEQPAPSSTDPLSARTMTGTSSQAAGEAVSSMTDYPYGPAADGEVVESPQRAPRKPKDSIQPDYSEALRGSWKSGGMTKLMVWGSVVGVVGVLGMTLCVLLAMVGFYFYTVSDYSSAISNLDERASTFQTTTLYASDGTTVLAEFNDPQRGGRREIELEQVSPWVIHALVSTEDETFYENPGFSVFAILRASYTNLTGDGPRSGASTITQQLARRLLLNEDFAAEVSASRKITEIILAAEISRQYSKNEILELYLNEVSFGSAVGIEAAAQLYFQKPASQLNIYESALLVGLVQSPGLYNPFTNREAALGRMETVLRLMTEANGDGCIQMEHDFAGQVPESLPGTPPEQMRYRTFDNLSQAPLCVTQAYLTNEVPHLRGPVEFAPFDPPVRELRYAHFAFWVWDQVVRGYGEEFIYNTGLNIYTTIDPAIQNVAEQALRDQLNEGRQIGLNLPQGNGSIVALNPRTGAVLAMVGSADFGNQDIDGEVNAAFSWQQPGSSIKPAVYLTALEGFTTGEGDASTFEYWTPATIIWDTPSSWGNYTPTNYDGTFNGPVSMRRALSNSLNIPAVKTLAFVTPERFQNISERMGIVWEPNNPPTVSGLAAALGASELYLFDQVAAYAAFANNGIYNAPYGIDRIETIDGAEVIYDAVVDRSANETFQTIAPEHAFLINSILSDTETRRQEFPTSYQNLDFEPSLPQAAVKTGTTNDNRDALTIGWTPQIIVGVWIGNTNNDSMGNAATGWRMASPVWNRTMRQAFQQISLSEQLITSFNPPGSVLQQTICADSGTQVPNNNPDLCGPAGTRQEFFAANQPPPPGDEGFIQVVQVDEFTNLLVNEYCPDYPVERVFLAVDDPTAIPWIQNTAAGQEWARSRDLDPNQLDGTLPTEACGPNYQRPAALLTSPVNGMTLSRQVAFTGQATVPNFDRYEIQYAPANTPDQYQVLPGQVYDQFDMPDPGSTLGLWPSNQIPDGQYYMRLAVYSTTGGEITSTPVLVTIQNSTGPGGGTNETVPGEAVPGGEIQ